MPLETLTAPEAAESSALRNFRPRNKRRILCAFPRYSYSFGTFNHAFSLGVVQVKPLLQDIVPIAG